MAKIDLHDLEQEDVVQIEKLLRKVKHDEAGATCIGAYLRCCGADEPVGSDRKLCDFCKAVNPETGIGRIGNCPCHDIRIKKHMHITRLSLIVKLNRERMEREALVGKELIFITSGGNRYEAVCAGVDPDIGISIVNKHDTEDVLRCLHGPYSPHGKEYTNYPYESFNRKWDEVVTEINAGVMDLRGQDVYGITHACPFGA